MTQSVLPYMQREEIIMGYTHYFYKKPKLKAKAFAAFAKDCYRLASASGVPIAFEYDETDKAPVFGDKLVRFNGLAEDGHETFYFERDWEKPYPQANLHDGLAFSFCKTARKPYDCLVTACLIAANHHFGDDLELGSDGDDSDWDEGREICQKILGYGDDFIVSSDFEDEE